MFCMFNALSWHEHLWSYLTSSPQAQQCCVISFFVWNMKPWSVLLPVLTVDKDVTRLALQLDSIDQARRWLANWNLAYLECIEPHAYPCRSPLSLQLLILWLFHRLSQDRCLMWLAHPGWLPFRLLGRFCRLLRSLPSQLVIRHLRFDFSESPGKFC